MLPGHHFGDAWESVRPMGTADTSIPTGLSMLVARPPWFLLKNCAFSSQGREGWAAVLRPEGMEVYWFQSKLNNQLIVFFFHNKLASIGLIDPEFNKRTGTVRLVYSIFLHLQSLCDDRNRRRRAAEWASRSRLRVVCVWARGAWDARAREPVPRKAPKGVAKAGDKAPG